MHDRVAEDHCRRDVERRGVAQPLQDGRAQQSGRVEGTPGGRVVDEESSRYRHPKQARHRLDVADDDERRGEDAQSKRGLGGERPVPPARVHGERVEAEEEREDGEERVLTRGGRVPGEDEEDDRGGRREA